MRIRPLLTMAGRGWRRPATLALALVAAVCVAGACLTARADLAARTEALHQLLADNPATLETVTTDVQLTAFLQEGGGDVTADRLAGQTDRVYHAVKTQFSIEPRSQAWGSVVNNGHAVSGAPGVLQPQGWNAPMLTLGYFEGLRQRSRLVAGRWPRPRSDDSGGTTVEVVVTSDTMRLWRASLGAELDDGTSDAWAGDLTVVVVGVIAPVQPSGAFWGSTGVLETPMKYVAGTGAPPNWDLGAFVGPDALAAGTLDDWNAEVAWNVPLDTGISADQAARLENEIDQRLTAASETLGNDPDSGLLSRFETRIDSLLLSFVDAQAAAELQTAMPEAGLAAIALLALALLLRWTLVVRHAETEIRHARGAGLGWLALTAAGESAFVIVPIGALGWAVGVLLPGEVPGGIARISGLLVLALPIAVGLGTLVRHGRIARRALRRGHQPRTSGYRLARRVVLFLTAAALCALSLQQAHAHGLSPATGIDAVSALSPIAAAGLATLAAAALAPHLIRVLLKPVRSRRGVVALLGLTRMARVPGPALVLLLVLSLALCTADLAVALARTPVGGSGAAAGSSAANAAQVGLLMHHSIGLLLAALAALAIAMACMVVALVALGDATERRAAAARLSVMGLTGAQQRNLTLTELSAPLALACLCASLTATPLLWVVRPAVTQGFTGDPRMTWLCLVLPVLIVIPATLATGLAGAGAARRGPAGSLRGGDFAEGIS